MFIKDILKTHKESEKIAVKYKGCSITYKELNKTVVNCTKKINNIVANINNVGLFIPNSIEYIVGFFTISYLDKVIVPIEPDLKGNQIKSIIDYCELGLIISNTKYISFIKKINVEFKSKIYLYNLDNNCIEKIGDNKEMVCSNSIQCLLSEDDTAVMLHTSGTTSNPKRVMLSHRNIICNIVSNISSLSINENDKCLIVLPMYFSYCNTSQFLSHFYVGASIVIFDSIFVPKYFVSTLKENQCTNASLVPPMMRLLTNADDIDYNVPTLRFLSFGGGPTSVNIIRMFMDRFKKIEIIQTYGQTEASPRISTLYLNHNKSKIGSVGKAIPSVSIRVVNENNQDVKIDEIGEVIVNGNNVMKGYYKHKEDTNNVVKNGWLYTGDLGRFDSDGFLYIVGRKKNVIICGGLNIYPEEIEEILLMHPDIIDAVVLKEKSDLLDEVPIAKVVLKRNSVKSKEKLIQYCTENLEYYKVPSKIIICEKLDKTYNGKLKRK